MNAFLLGKQNMDFGKEVLYGKNARQQYMYEDVSNATYIPEHPEIQEVNFRGELLLPNIEPGDEGNYKQVDEAAPAAEGAAEATFDEEAAQHEAMIQKINDDKETYDKNLEIRAEREAREKEEEEKDEKRRADEMADFEDKQVERMAKEAAEIEEEKASRAAGTAGASGLPEQIGTELTVDNLINNMIRLNTGKMTHYAAVELETNIKELSKKTLAPHLTLDKLRPIYADLLVLNPSRVPDDIQPDPALVVLRNKLFKMNAQDIRSNVLPAFIIVKEGKVKTTRSTLINPFDYPPIVDPVKYKNIMTQGLPLAHVRQLMWDAIIADQHRGQKGWGLTNHTIKQEGMNSDEIAQVLKKKTHHVIPVIASDQIATLLPLVNNKTQRFGFVINSQSEKKPGLHWKAIYFDRKRAEVCYFDSLVSEPTEAVMRGIKQIMRKMADPLYFKLKINRIKFQANDTSTCGPFALKFIADMYAGKQFKVATRFTDDSIDGEKSIRKYISRWGYV